MGGQRARGLLAIVGGSAVAGAAAVLVLTSPAPQTPINVCALVPSLAGCTPPLGSGNFQNHNLGPSTVIPQDTVNALPTH
jgi:hypothetical protein